MPETGRSCLPAIGAALALLLLLVPPAGAGPAHSLTVIAIHPSYARWGGVAINWSRVVITSGNGSAGLLSAPTFALGNGNAAVGTVARVQGGTGVAEMVAAVGVSDLSFVCPNTCAGTGHYAVVTWNLTDVVSVVNNCAPGHGDGRATLVLVGRVIDRPAISGIHLAGSGSRTIWHIGLSTGGSWGASENGQLVSLRFPVNLTLAHTYVLESYLFERVLAYSSGCLVRSTASIGYWGHDAPTGRSYLREISIR